MTEFCVAKKKMIVYLASLRKSYCYLYKNISDSNLQLCQTTEELTII